MPRVVLVLAVFLLAACDREEAHPQAEIVPPAGPPTENPAAYQSGATIEPPPLPAGAVAADSAALPARPVTPPVAPPVDPIEDR